MMKVKGKILNISPFKAFLNDQTFDQLDYIKEKCKLHSNVDAITLVVNHVYTMLKTKDDWAENEIQVLKKDE